MSIELMTPAEALDEFNLLIALGLFIFYMFVEMLDSGLTFSLTQHKAFKTAGMTFILYIVLGIEIIAFVANYLYVIPVAIGASIGAYLVVMYEKKKRSLNKNDS